MGESKAKEAIYVKWGVVELKDERNVFFLFKQKTAYEISACLVGSAADPSMGLFIWTGTCWPRC